LDLARPLPAADFSAFGEEFPLARRALSLVVTRRPQLFENLVALTGIELGSRRSSSVCLPLALASDAGARQLASFLMFEGAPTYALLFPSDLQLRLVDARSVGLATAGGDRQAGLLGDNAHETADGVLLPPMPSLG
jgi:hypothetical protein